MASKDKAPDFQVESHGLKFWFGGNHAIPDSRCMVSFGAWTNQIYAAPVAQAGIGCEIPLDVQLEMAVEALRVASENGLCVEMHAPMEADLALLYAWRCYWKDITPKQFEKDLALSYKIKTVNWEYALMQAALRLTAKWRENQ